MLTLYGCGSPNVLKVLILLEELGLDYRLETVDPIRGEQYSAAFGALNPNRKVPVLVDPGGAGTPPVTLWESGAILVYLSERHGGAFHSTDPVGRYVVLQWLMLQMASIGPMLGQLSHFRNYATGPEHGYARARYATEAKRLYDVVEARLAASAWLGGDAYTIADIAAWPWLHRIEARGADRAGLPNTVRWIDAIAARPAVVRARAILEPMANVDIAQMVRDHPDAVDRYLMRGRYSRPGL